MRNPEEHFTNRRKRGHAISRISLIAAALLVQTACDPVRSGGEQSVGERAGLELVLVRTSAECRTTPPSIERIAEATYFAEVARRLCAVKLLANAKKLTPAAVVALGARQGDANFFVRRAARSAFNRVGPEAGPALVSLLASSDAPCSAAAHRRLRELGRSVVPALVVALIDPAASFGSDRARRRAGRGLTLGLVKKHGERAAEEFLRLLIRDPDKNGRGAVEGLRLVGCATVEPLLFRVSQSTGPEATWALALFLGLGDAAGSPATVDRAIRAAPQVDAAGVVRCLRTLGENSIGTAIHRAVGRGSDDPTVTGRLGEVVDHFGKTAVTTVIALLDAENEDARGRARDWLSRRGARDVLPCLLDAVRTGRVKAKGLATSSLLRRWGGDAFPALEKLIVGGEEPAASNAAAALATATDGQALPPVVWRYLRTGPDPHVLRLFTIVAGRVSTKESLAVARARSAWFRQLACVRLAATRCRSSVAFLLGMLSDRSDCVRRGASQALLKPGLLVPEDYGVIAKLLDHDRAEVRQLAARTLARSDGPVLDALAAGMKNADEQVREICARALDRMGTRATPMLIQTLRRKNALERPDGQLAWQILRGRPTDGSLPVWIELLQGTGPEVTLHAIRAVAAQRANASPAVPALAALLNHDDRRIRLAAVDALAAIGSGAVPTLRKAVRSRRFDVGDRAYDILRRWRKLDD